MASQAAVGRLSSQAQESLVKYCKTVLDLHNRMSELRDKMEYIDIAYARYNYRNSKTGSNDGVDVRPEDDIACGLNQDEITVPIVVSQVDSYVAYLSEVFLSGYPMFPVVSTPDLQGDANKLQAIMDDHSIRGRYQRQLLMNFKDACKYNLSAVELDWCAIDNYSVLSAYDQLSKKEANMAITSFSINKLTRMDPYNTIFDYRVHPVDIPYKGEFAGYIEIISRIELKRRLQYFATTQDGYHTSQALTIKLGNLEMVPGFLGYYKEAPQISNLISRKDVRRAGIQDWVAWINNNRGLSSRMQQFSDVYEYVTLYVRLIPEEHGMVVPRKGSPQVWKLCFVNHDKLVYAKRIFSIYEMLPMIFSQPFEDGFDLQTESIAERSIPFQKATSNLLSVRLNGARRAIMDRAIYDPSMIAQNDINSPTAAPKIPLKPNSQINGRTIEQSYKSIPFNDRGMDSVIQDMAALSKMADLVNGLNQPQQGQFQKGNKSRKEWDDTMDNANAKPRNVALSMEMQFFIPIKEQAKLNIYQYQPTGAYQDMKTGSMYKIEVADIVRIKENIGHFKIADGFTPASKLASTDVIVQGLQMLGQSPVLQAQLGPAMPKMWVHLMQLGGVEGLEQYLGMAPAASGGAPQQPMQAPAPQPQQPPVA